MSTPDFDKWLDGLPLYEEDHVFLPVGQQSDELTALYNQRAALLEPTPEGVPEAERSMAESYTDARDALDAQIAEMLEKDHPKAPRIRLRAITDEDVTDAGTEVLALTNGDGKPLDTTQQIVEANLRYISRATVEPKLSVDDVRLLRSRINRGEWARLVDHVNELSLRESSEANLPNS